MNIENKIEILYNYLESRIESSDYVVRVSDAEEWYEIYRVSNFAHDIILGKLYGEVPIVKTFYDIDSIINFINNELIIYVTEDNYDLLEELK